MGTLLQLQSDVVVTVLCQKLNIQTMTCQKLIFNCFYSFLFKILFFDYFFDLTVVPSKENMLEIALSCPQISFNGGNSFESFFKAIWLHAWKISKGDCKKHLSYLLRFVTLNFFICFFAITFVF